MGDNIFLYDHEASLRVESMSKANKPARDRAAVDVVMQLSCCCKWKGRRVLLLNIITVSNTKYCTVISKQTLFKVIEIGNKSYWDTELVW